MIFYSPLIINKENRGTVKKNMNKNQKYRLKNNKTTKKNKNIIKYTQPFYQGLTLKVYTMSPKKPNSALRKVAKVKLNKPIGPKNQRIIIAYIPKEKHSLSIHNLVLVKPGRTQDLPGIKYKIIRGKLDCK